MIPPDNGFVHAPAMSLRGARDYVHSTDLYEEMVAGGVAGGVPPTGALNFRLHAKITRQPLFTYLRGEEPAAAAAARGYYTSGDQRWTVLITESDQPVTLRKTYDESPAARNATLEDRQASLVAPTGLRPIETVTALAVLLHKTVLAPPAGRRWMLGELALSRPLRPSDSSILRIRIDRVMSAAMTRSTMDAEDGPLGTMLFILADG